MKILSVKAIAKFLSVKAIAKILFVKAIVKILFVGAIVKMLSVKATVSIFFVEGHMRALRSCHLSGVHLPTAKEKAIGDSFRCWGSFCSGVTLYGFVAFSLSGARTCRIILLRRVSC